MRTLFGTRLPRAMARFYPDMTWRMPPLGRTLYLTFDDGPTREGTDGILELLDRYHVPATFFVIGRNVERHPELTREIASRGHSVGNHTFSHPNAWRVRPLILSDELSRGTDVISETLNRPVTTMRPPFGRFTRAMRDWCRDNGQRMIMWDVLTWDFVERIPPAEISRCMLGLARPGSIVVLHDNSRTYRNTLEALHHTLPLMVEHGWSFGRL